MPRVAGVDIPKKELASSVKQRIYSSPEERNIYKEVRVITANDRKINPNIPKNAKFKVQVPSGEKGTSTKMVYTTTKSAAENAIKKARAACHQRVIFRIDWRECRPLVVCLFLFEDLGMYLRHGTTEYTQTPKYWCNSALSRIYQNRTGS